MTTVITRHDFPNWNTIIISETGPMIFSELVNDFDDLRRTSSSFGDNYSISTTLLIGQREAASNIVFPVVVLVFSTTALACAAHLTIAACGCSWIVTATLRCTKSWKRGNNTYLKESLKTQVTVSNSLCIIAKKVNKKTIPRHKNKLYLGQQTCPAWHTPPLQQLCTAGS